MSGTLRIVVVVALLVVTVVAPGTAAAQSDPNTANEYLRAFEELRGDPAFEAYGEFELVRGQAVAAVQVGEFSEGERRRMALVLRSLRSFADAHARASAGDRAAAFHRANETATTLARLEDAGGGRYAALGRIALERFYADQGARLFDLAREATRTPQRLRYYDRAADAFRAAGRTEQFSRVSARRSRLAAEFRADARRMDESSAAARRVLDDCGGACAGPMASVLRAGPGVFDRYVTVRRADGEAREALRLARAHGLDDRELADLSARTSRALSATAAGSALTVFGYALAVWVLAVPVVRRLARWGRDAEDAALDGVVPTGREGER